MHLTRNQWRNSVLPTQQLWLERPFVRSKSRTYSAGHSQRVNKIVQAAHTSQLCRLHAKWTKPCQVWINLIKQMADVINRLFVLDSARFVTSSTRMSLIRNVQQRHSFHWHSKGAFASTQNTSSFRTSRSNKFSHRVLESRQWPSLQSPKCSEHRSKLSLCRSIPILKNFIRQPLLRLAIDLWKILKI